METPCNDPLDYDNNDHRLNWHTNPQNSDSKIIIKAFKLKHPFPLMIKTLMIKWKSTFIMTSQVRVSQTHTSERVCEFDPLYDNKTMNFRRPLTIKLTDSNIGSIGDGGLPVRCQEWHRRPKVYPLGNIKNVKNREKYWQIWKNYWLD